MMHSKTFWVIAGTLAVISLFDSTIAGVLNPVLTPLKLSYNG